MNSVTYESLHHTHLLVAHVSVTNKLYTNIRQKKKYSSSTPQFPCIEIPSIPDFSYISCFINFFYFLDSSCKWKFIQCVTKNLPNVKKSTFRADMLGVWQQLFQERVTHFFWIMDR